MAEIGQGKDRIAGRVDQLQALTEREILACGAVLSTIVDNVRDLIGETQRTVAASTARSKETTSRFIADMQGDILAQDAAVSQVLLLAEGVEDAIESINGLTQYSNILAINARIEAARIGEQGRGFAVIADHIRELSKTIRESADKVGSAIGAVRQGLPPVRERATSMRDRTLHFVDMVDEQVKSASLHTEDGSGASGRLDVVMELSNKALSHLQFQDPMVQELGSINRDLGVVECRVGRILDGEVDLEPAEYDHDRSANGDQPQPGKIILF